MEALLSRARAGRGGGFAAEVMQGERRGETIVFTPSWPYILADGGARSSHREELVRSRGLVLEVIADYLSGVVEIHRAAPS